ncbi:MAG: T9SS type A sorting domain-containing protein [Saprospiraceae bacterium]|nr:T9SS type A sorting domain-containing protein [Saprospiraceae bacterium]
MKKNTLLLVVSALTLSVTAQAPVKRYVTIEHFTNSRCGICASRNPAFYTTIDPYATDVHHVSIHPPVPYTNCVFYQANTTENSALAGVYGIQGTPRVALNGTLIPAGNPLLPAATFQQYLNQTSPLYVQVVETTGSTRDVTIRLRTQDAIPAGNYKLYALIAEKEINLTTPNGEKVHHDVFRQMLTPVAGVDYTPAALGQEVVFNYNYTLNSGWQPNETFVTAYVRNTATGEILNSGTRFDPIILNAGEQTIGAVTLTPNPANAVTFAQLGDDTAQNIEVFDSAGRRVSLQQGADNPVSIRLDGLEPGLYFVRILGEKGLYVAKVVKE